MLLPALLCLLATQFQYAQAQNRPNFTDTSEIASGTIIREDTPTNRVIATVKAIDIDGDYPITYSLDGEAAQYMQIDPLTGQISLKAMLDYERTTTLKITVVATDSTGDAKGFGSDFQIQDANDLAPFFNETYYNYNLHENTTVGHNITTLYVRDRDVSNFLLSVICDSSTQTLARACEVFGVKMVRQSNQDWTGKLQLLAPLDYELEKSYSVRLLANDGRHTTPQEIQIGVLDINDSPPSFVRAQGILVPEGQPAGTTLDYVSAVDTDEVDARPIRYELIGNAEALRYFTLNDVNGSITTLKPLDYEDPDRIFREEFTLTIRARELLNNVTGALGNDNRTSTNTTITVRLLDINDNCPQFGREEYFVSIREDISQGSNIPLQMTVTDADTGDRSDFDLQLIDQSGTFAVTPTSGRSPASVTITVVRAANIDYEASTRPYLLTVRAIPTGEGSSQQSCSSSTLVHITVEDVNDENPRFARATYDAQVRETAGERTFVIAITATDPDSGSYGQAGLRYSLVGVGDDLFQIDPVSGVVTVARCEAQTYGTDPCLDHEKKQHYDLAVQARDSDGQDGSLLGTTQLRIEVLDDNDNRPRFSIEYIRSIRENSTVTTDPLVVKATDPDGRTILYSIPRLQDEAKSWTIDPISGNITALKPIFYSDLVNPTRGSFKFQAMASDGDFTDLADITIYVIDTNDHTPEFFPPENYTFSIAENTPGNYYIATIACADGDAPTTGNGQLDVSIDGGGFGKFIVRSNGTSNDFFWTEILTAPSAEFDFDVQNRYELVVKARDRGSPSRTGTTHVIINILDINNKNPYFDPPTSSVSVQENMPVGYLVTTVTARDNDADKQLEIRFSGQAQAFNPSGVRVTNPALFQDLFAIDSAGNVRVNSPLDRDVVSFISFDLFVEDTNSATLQTGTGKLFIRILEYNDQSPQFELPFYNLSVLEERPLSTFVGSILARDEDDQIESYTLRSNPGQLFIISTSSGVLQVNGRLDYERQHNVTLVAEAFDSGSPSLSNTTVIFINIININDNAPLFNQSLYQITMLENSRRTDAYITVSATDKDEGDFGEVRYSANDPYFTVDANTGEVFLKPGTDLDRETDSTYSFLVTAYDSPNNATARLNTTVSVYITLQDVNDNCPVFDPPARYIGSVIETADIGDQVLELFARDIDAGLNRRIRFTIDRDSARPPNGYDLFSIQSIQSDYADKESGRIEVKNSLRKKFGVYNFTVVASDRNGDNSTGEVCSVRAPVSVRVQEAINDAPVWFLPPSKNFSITVLESQYEGMLVYDCKAVDENTGLAGIIDYSFNVQQRLTQATPEFRINPITGVIRAEVIFDREEVDSYVLTVVAKDRGDPPASSETVLIVRVLDVNDNDPEFPMRNGETIPYNFEIPEGVSADNVGVIGMVSAVDRDTDNKNNIVYYRIVAGNDDGLFMMDRETGELRLNPDRASAGLDREQQDVYSMDVLAYNEVHDDTVIRSRRKRSTNPSVVTVNVKVEDQNDTPPMFTGDDYHGCVSVDAHFGQSITRVEAVDLDLNGATSVNYTKVSETTGDYFTVDPLGVIRNNHLLHDIGSRQPVLTVQAFDSTEPAGRLASDATVKIFVTERSNEVVLEVSQPLADVRAYRDQLIRVLKTKSPSSQDDIKYVCIMEIRDAEAGGTVSFTSSEVVMAAVGETEEGNHFIYSAGDLRGILLSLMKDENTAYFYRNMHVQDVVTEAESDEFILTEDPVLAVFIIVILLVFLAIILFCLACFCIRNSKRRQIKKLMAEGKPVGYIQEVEFVRQESSGPVEVETTVEPLEVKTSFKSFEPQTTVNPLYDVPRNSSADVYAVVQKPRKTREETPDTTPVVPVIIPAVDEGRPGEVYVVEPVPEELEDYQPVTYGEPVTYRDPVTFREPVIVTEPVMMEEEPQLMAPPPDDFFEEEPVIVSEVLPYDIPEDPDNAQDSDKEDEPASEKDRASVHSYDEIESVKTDNYDTIRSRKHDSDEEDEAKESDRDDDANDSDKDDDANDSDKDDDASGSDKDDDASGSDKDDDISASDKEAVMETEIRDSASDTSSYNSPSDCLLHVTPPTPPQARSSPSPPLPPPPEPEEMAHRIEADEHYV